MILSQQLKNFSIYTDKIELYISNMIKKFNDLYPINKKINIPFLGRYINDKYFKANNDVSLNTSYIE